METLRLFSVDNSVYVAADDIAGMQRIVWNRARCPFSLARIIKISDTGKVIYCAGKSGCRAFPEQGKVRIRMYGEVPVIFAGRQ